MLTRLTLAFGLLLAALFPAHADDRLIRLTVPPTLADSGLMAYVLPRFSLKTQVKVQIVGPGEEAEAALGDAGTPVFSGEGATWALADLAPDHPGVRKFRDWITAEVGQRAITGFTRDGVQIFTPPVIAAATAGPATFEGDAKRGAVLARTHCGRCHVSTADAPHRGIGSTPSFFVLRALGNWEERLRTFYLRAPHPSFTQVEDVTGPFPDTLPPAVRPVEMTLDDLESIIAYTAGLAPADLGAPIRSQ